MSDDDSESSASSGSANSALPEPIFTKHGVWRRVLDRDTPIKQATAPSPVKQMVEQPEVPAWRKAELASVASLAELIVGDLPEPAWLRPGLMNAVAAVRFARVEEKKHPARTKLSKRLVRVREAAAVLSVELDPGLDGDTGVLAALEVADPDHWLASADVGWRATGIIHLVNKALTAIPLGHGKQGRQKHYPEPVRQPQAICAAAVTAAWCRTSDALPEQPSVQMQKACAALWALADGNKGSLARWVVHLTRAMKEPAGHGREEMERILGAPILKGGKIAI